MKKLTVLLFASCFFVLANAQVILPAYQGIHQPKYKDCGIITDYDGNQYYTVIIGTQCWMKENLEVTHYPNGEAIPLVTDNTAWANLVDNNIDDAYCWYNNDISNKNTYGALYTYAAAIGDDWARDNAEDQGVCPDNWHLPNDTEWTILTNYLGGESVAGGKMKKTGTTHWNSPNFGANNSSGFSALPSGARKFYNGIFFSLESIGVWWYADEYNSVNAYCSTVQYNNADFNSSNASKSIAFSVRCVKNNDCGTVSDYDGNVYQTVTIGNQCWMKENLKVTHYPNGIAIPLIEDNTTWANLADNNTDGAYCYYNNNASNEADTYGALYTYAAAIGDNWVNDNNDEQGICPNGWHLPSDEEWNALENFLGINAGSKLAGNTTLWTDGILDQNSNFGTSDFSALPSGGRNLIGDFYYLSYGGWYWSNTDGGINALGRGLDYNSTTIGSGGLTKSNGFSVRCVKD